MATLFFRERIDINVQSPRLPNIRNEGDCYGQR
jgi:hypothetical protein